MRNEQMSMRMRSSLAGGLGGTRGYGDVAMLSRANTQARSAGAALQPPRGLLEQQHRGQLACCVGMLAGTSEGRCAPCCIPALCQVPAPGLGSCCLLPGGVLVAVWDQRRHQRDVGETKCPAPRRSPVINGAWPTASRAAALKTRMKEHVQTVTAGVRQGGVGWN